MIRIAVAMFIAGFATAWLLAMYCARPAWLHLSGRCDAEACPYE